METIRRNLEAVAEFVELAERFRSVPGYLFDAEGYLLYSLARGGPGQGAIVEIGSFLGRSTCWLAAGAASAGRETVTAIDTFQGSPEHQGDATLKAVIDQGGLLAGFRHNLAAQGLAHQAVPLVGASSEFAQTWDAPIRLLFIDGDHSYEGVARDFIAWERWVVPGGVVCLHDVGVWEGVTAFYSRNLLRNKRYREAAAVDSLRCFAKAGA